MSETTEQRLERCETALRTIRDVKLDHIEAAALAANALNPPPPDPAMEAAEKAITVKSDECFLSIFDVQLGRWDGKNPWKRVREQLVDGLANAFRQQRSEGHAEMREAAAKRMEDFDTERKGFCLIAAAAIRNLGMCKAAEPQQSPTPTAPPSQRSTLRAAFEWLTEKIGEHNGGLTLSLEELIVEQRKRAVAAEREAVEKFLALRGLHNSAAYIRTGEHVRTEVKS